MKKYPGILFVYLDNKKKISGGTRGNGTENQRNNRINGTHRKPGRTFRITGNV